MTELATLTEDFGAFDFHLTRAEEERARRLHSESIVVDMLFQGPCGYRAFNEVPVPARRGDWESDWYVVKEAPVRHALAGSFDGFRACWFESGVTAGNRQAGFLRPYDVGFSSAQAQVDRFPWMVKALRADDIRHAKAEGKVAGYITTQDAEGIDRELRKLEQAYDLGMRMVGLTYNQQNSVGSGCTERNDGGISDFGARVIALMDELGMIIDTAHSGRQTTLDACQLSERPVVASHTSASDVYAIDRAKSDDELHAIAETDGVIGVYAVPFFLGSGDGLSIEVMLDHIDYIRALVGWQHVGIGTDWPLQADRASLADLLLGRQSERGFRTEHNLTGENLIGFDDYRDFPNLTRGLVSRGYSDEQIRGILGGNFLRVFEIICG